MKREKKESNKMRKTGEKGKREKDKVLIKKNNKSEKRKEKMSWLSIKGEKHM